MQRVLLVEDEPAIVAAVRDRLEAEGFAVVAAPDAATAADRLAEGAYDLLLLDLGLPDLDGLELLGRLRGQGHDLPVIILSARGDEGDRVRGLELGADDYLAKPFSARELAARARALLRRTAEAAALRAMLPQQPAQAPAEPPAALQLDPARRQASFRGSPLDLRPREFDLLALLARHPGQVFSREALLRQVWGQERFLDARTVDVHVRRLRARLAAIDPEANLIQTEWGVGYRLVAE